MSDEARRRTEQSIADGYGGDTYRRKFTGNVAQCGCYWAREPQFGDVLNLCAIHAAANRVEFAKFEAEREPTPPPAEGKGQMLPVVLIPHPHVRVDQGVLGGSPYVAGSRVPVRRMFQLFSGGASVERICRRYPQLGPSKVFDALAFALDNPDVIQADIAREQELLERAQRRAPRPADPTEVPDTTEGKE